jgi:aarF domain-containing kinase
MEFIHGAKITDLESIKKMNLSVKEVAQTMIEIFARQIFCYGFVHCDPHRMYS